MSDNLSSNRLVNCTRHRNHMVPPILGVNSWKVILLHPWSMGEASRFAIHRRRIDSTHSISRNAWIFHLFTYFKNVLSIDDKIGRLCYS